MSGFYDSTAWRRFRAQTLRQRPLCQVDGCGQASRHLDHRVPIRAGGAPLDPANVQALCASCHSRKTALSDGGYGNRRGAMPLRATGCDVNGLPRDPHHRWNQPMPSLKGRPV